jgi:hypothetical protein
MATAASLQVWVNLVEGIESQLTTILSNCQEPEQPAPPSSFREGPLQEKLGHVQNRVGSIHTCLTRAGQSVKEVDAMLEQEADALTHWLTLVKELDARATACSADEGAPLSLPAPPS